MNLTPRQDIGNAKPLLMYFTPRTQILEDYKEEIPVYDGITQTVSYNFASKKSTMSMKAMSTKHGKGIATTSDKLKKKDD